MKRKKAALVLWPALFILLLGLRFMHLGSDPPDDWTRTSLGYMSDPGGYAHNARNQVLFGQWEIDNWNRMYASIIPHYVTYLSFVLFGPGIASMNAVPALFSALLLFVFFFIMRRSYGFGWAVAGTLLLGVNYIFTVFSQVAVRAVPMLFFVVLALFFLTRRPLPNKRELFLAGSMCFLAFTAKGTLLQVLPAVFLGTLAYFLFQNLPRWRSLLSAGGVFLLGFLATMGIWLATVYLPHIKDFQDFAASNFFWLTHGYERPLEVFWMRPLFFFMDMPVLTVLSSLALLGLAYRAFTAPGRISLLSWVSGFWVISNMVYYSIIYYRAARHLFPLILPLIVLAVGLMYDFVRIEKIRRPENAPFLFLGFLCFWIIYASSSLLILIDRPVRQDMWSRSFVQVLGLALLGTGLGYLILRFWPRNFTWGVSPGFKRATVAFLIMFSVSFNLRAWVRWAQAPRADRRNISRDLGNAFSDMRLAGLVSMVMCMENTHRAHAYSSGYINKGVDFLERYGITHALLTAHAEEIHNYRKDFPQAMQKARILARYPIWNTYLVLYELGDEPARFDSGMQILEGEAFFGENGIPRFDPAASGKLAFAAEAHPQGALLKLPLPEYPAGRYEISFHLKIRAEVPDEERVARIDVTSENRRRGYVQKELYGPDLPAGEGYLPFKLELNLNRARQLTLRLFSTGKTELWFDQVTVKRLSP